MSVIDTARVWLRERGERIAEKKAAKRASQRHGHESRFWLLSIPATATLCAAFVEVYWAVLFCIQATGRLDNDWAVALGAGLPMTGSWHFAFDIRSVPVLIGLVAATVPIVMWSMVWLPVQMKARGTGMWRRVTMIVAGLLANALVIVSGTVVMNSNRQEQVRAGQVVEQQAGQSRAQLQSQIDGITADLNTMFNNRNAYMAQAASVGAARWSSTYVTQARTSNDPRLPMIERALGAAQAADDARARRDVLRSQLAAAPTQAAVAAHVEDHAGVGLDTFATYANVYRPPFVALICTIIGIFGTWWWVGLAEAMNSHNVSLSGWAPEDHRIEDLRAEDAVAAEPMQPAKEEVYDAESGEKLTRVKPHWRKLKKGQKQRVEVTPDPLPDEPGAPEGVDGGDGGMRSAALHDHAPLVRPPSAEPQPERSGAAQDDHPQQEEQQEPRAETQDEPPLTEDEETALLALIEADEATPHAAEDEANADAAPAEQQVDEHPASLLETPPQQVANLDEQRADMAEGQEVEPDHAEDSEHHDDGLKAAVDHEPETDPRRLIAAE